MQFSRVSSILCPLIKEVLTCRKSFDYVTILNLTSQFYHFGISSRAKKLCTITTPFGLYEYCHLPMGIKNSLAFAQAVMESILRDYVMVECFIDDIGIFTFGSFSNHRKEVKDVLSEMNNANFLIKPKKCFWARGWSLEQFLTQPETGVRRSRPPAENLPHFSQKVVALHSTFKKYYHG